MTGNQPFTVNDWTVEPDRNRLVRGDESQRVRPQVMNLLVYLASRPGTVARSDELMRELWPQRIVTDATLYNCIAELRQALGEGKDGPHFVQTVHKKGYRLCAEVGSLPETQVDVETSTSSNPEVRKALQLGDQRMNRGNLDGWKQAEKYYRRAIQLESDNPRAWQKLAECIVSQFGTFEKPVTQLREALDAARHAIELDAGNGLAWISQARAEEALALAENRSIPQDRLHEHYRQGLDLVPNSADAMREYGLLLLRTTGQAENAIELLENSVKLDPLVAANHFALGRAYRFARRSDYALTSLKRSLELQPDNPYPIWEIGLAYYTMGELADSLDWGIRALEFERDDPSGPFLLAQVALNLGDIELATKWTKQGLRGAPDTPIAAAAQMSLALAREDMRDAYGFAETLIPHAGELRIVHPGAVAQALWILRDRDLENGRARDAQDRYARCVPLLFESEVSGEGLWLVAAVDVAYLFLQLGEKRRARGLLEVVRQEVPHRQVSGARELAPEWLEIESTALLGDTAAAESLLCDRIRSDWICWWHVLATRPTLDSIRDSEAMIAAADTIQSHREEQRKRHANRRRPGAAR